MGTSSPSDVSIARLRASDEAVATARDSSVTDEGVEQARERVFSSLASAFGSEGASEESGAQRFRAVLEAAADSPHRQLLAVAVLRLLPFQSMSVLHDHDWRQVVLRLLTSQLGDVSPQETGSLQTHERLERLARLQTSAEGELGKAVMVLTSLERAGACRQELMAALKKKFNQRLLRPFLPNSLDARIGELFTIVNSYVQQRNDPSVADAYRRVVEEAEAFAQELEAYGTHYAALVLDGVVKTLIRLVREDFSNNKVVRPASLRLVTTEKAYPLQRAGSIEVALFIHNDGPGYAQDTSLFVVLGQAATLTTDGEIPLGQLRPLTSSRVDIGITIHESMPSVQLLVQLSWKNFDQEQRQQQYSFELRAQRTDIDWIAASKRSPYSLEPVQRDSDLVGRKDVLERLVALVQTANVGSAIIHGQKRVGKTSIAKALRTRALAMGCTVLYIEGGDYIHPSPDMTIQQLGRRVCRLLRQCSPKLGGLAIPELGESLAPLVDFLEDTMILLGDGSKILLILDEFDELPPDLYQRTPIANAFFLALRSITSRPDVGIVLVGGEKMRHVMDGQGEKLNKWTFVPVDYFSREKDWPDYVELVRRPTVDVLDFSDEAVASIAEASAGNPYFTHLICLQAFRSALARQDCHVTEIEIAHAVAATVRETERNSFQHFWEDGIVVTGDQSAERSVSRRRVLIALADVLTQQAPCSNKDVEAKPIVQGLSVDAELRELLSRNVLKGDTTAGIYDFAVPFFFKWLQARGLRDVLSTFEQWDEALLQRKQLETLRVKPTEVSDLVRQWTSYQGQVISERHVEAWLEQFGSIPDQRLMFKILQGLHFYSNSFVRSKMPEIEELVRRWVSNRVGGHRLGNGEMAVSYLDGPAKSGAQMARLYADSVGLRPSDVVERSQLARRLLEEERIRAVVVLDDFVGTGNSAREGLRGLHDDIAEVVRKRDIKVVFGVVAAVKSGWQAIVAEAASLQFGVRCHCCEMLEERDLMFGEVSNVFPEPTERSRAKEIASQIGAKLEKNCPLGYGGFGLAVVFERSCPNNALPILWSESSSPKWSALFRRF